MDANRALLTDNEKFIVQDLDNMDKYSEEDDIFDNNLRDLEKYSSGSSESGHVLLDEDEIICENGFSVAEQINQAFLEQQRKSPKPESSLGDFGEMVDEFQTGEAEKLAKEFVKNFSQIDFVKNLEDVADLSLKNADQLEAERRAGTQIWMRKMRRTDFDFHAKKAIAVFCPNLGESEIQGYCEFFYQTLAACKVIEFL